MAGTTADIQNTACDVIIIGGGVIGCAAAYNLAKKGRSVTVLDREPNIGEGASSRNGGGVRQSGRDGRELPLAMYAVEHLWPQLADELGADVEYVKKGNLRLGKTEAHLETLRGLAKMSQERGLDMKMISAEEVREINPYLSDQVIGASWCPTDGHANPMRTTLAYYRAALKLGVRFITGVEVKGLRKVRGRLGIVQTNVGDFTAENVVLAAGLGSRGIAASVGIDIPMTGSLIECLVTEAEPTMFPQMLGVATRRRTAPSSSAAARASRNPTAPLAAVPPRASPRPPSAAPSWATSPVWPTPRSCAPGPAGRTRAPTACPSSPTSRRSRASPSPAPSRAMASASRLSSVCSSPSSCAASPRRSMSPSSAMTDSRRGCDG